MIILLESYQSGDEMMKDEIYHRAFGVYGIYYRQEQGLLVISKTSGPAICESVRFTWWQHGRGRGT